MPSAEMDFRKEKKKNSLLLVLSFELLILLLLGLHCSLSSVLAIGLLQTVISGINIPKVGNDCFKSNMFSITLLTCFIHGFR